MPELGTPVIIPVKYQSWATSHPSRQMPELGNPVIIRVKCQSWAPWSSFASNARAGHPSHHSRLMPELGTPVIIRVKCQSWATGHHSRQRPELATPVIIRVKASLRQWFWEFTTFNRGIPSPDPCLPSPSSLPLFPWNTIISRLGGRSDKKFWLH